jgi:hypothetical protein
VHGKDAAFMFGTMGFGQGMRGVDGCGIEDKKLSSFSPVIKHDLEKD